MTKRLVLSASLLGLAVVPLLLSSSGCLQANRGMTAPSEPLICDMTRDECTLESLGEGGVQCDRFESFTFRATLCTTNLQNLAAQCNTAYCFKDPDANPNAAYDYPRDNDRCRVNSATLARNTTLVLPNEGTCSKAPVPSAGNRASVDWRKHSHSCTRGNGGVCTTIADNSMISPPPQENCIDLTKASAKDQIQADPLDRDRATEYLKVQLDDPACAIQQSALTSYDFTPGPLGTATAAGSTVPFSSTRGFAQFSSDRLVNLRIDVANLTVAGNQLTNVYVSNTFPAPLLLPDPDDQTRTGFAPGKLQLIVLGLVGGVPQRYLVHNDTQVNLVKSNTTLQLSGTFTIIDQDPNGNPLPITVTFSAPGTKSTPATTACANLSARDRLFGFEDPQSWSSSNAALSLVTSPIRQGCGALGIQGSGFMPINSTPFGAGGLTVTNALSVDLFIPNNQPNQFYLGALQMYLSCPSVGSNNQYIGQVELTGKPQNAYSTLRFPLPSEVKATLAKAAKDCAWGFALNANPTNRTWILDNLRFTN